MSGNSLNESRIKFFQLNSYDNSLDLTGNIELNSGKITIKIVSADTDEVFFTDDYVKNNSVDIHIGSLNNQKNINMILSGENVGKYSLRLTSLQKLVLDKDKPEKPKK